MAGTSYNPRARFLGAELREARVAAGIGVRELAKKLGIGHAKISLWENGKKIPTTEDVARYLTAIEVTGDEFDRLLDMARSAGQPNWLEVGIPGIAEQLAALMWFEKVATTIAEVGPLVIPGLLQTGDYARSIMGDRPTADTRVAMRLGRRDVLTRRNPAEFTALIGEAALRQPIAEPDVMAAQLDHLLKTAELPNVTIQVMPANTRWHPGLLGPFVVLTFPKAKPIVHVEHHRSSAFIFDDDDVQAYFEAIDRIHQVTLSPEESLGLIAKVIKETT
ncbi:MAG: helix-turn-helix domain-containing protein [Actinophytocola sp.]|uniref:helix-turn-helix domain-containing protein n=1 Tax=Actinophytocola sp. TaxID=1872138 RepID=UPI001328DE9A|nr:helix-turn-helix transcriptional regulator [Actinophytocola sp.]MPZ81738.1 helix-turn-helix domain-containing protein [Actinophytocola sp.]